MVLGIHLYVCVSVRRFLPPSTSIPLNIGTYVLTVTNGVCERGSLMVEREGERKRGGIC